MIVSLLIFVYLVTILIFRIGFDRIPDFKPSKNEPIINFTIVIPFRNEANHLLGLLQSISKMDYPSNLVEYIFVDDESTDNSIQIINSQISDLGLDEARIDISIVKNYRTSNSPKKDAITTALNGAKNKWIITTDADCILPEKWLQIFDNYIQQNDCNMIVAPVTYIANQHFFHQFQLLDFWSLQASTISGFGLQYPFLCNGANLAYKKEVFIKVNGFKNNNSIASGDDVFLLEKFLKLDKGYVHYLKSNEVLVQTYPLNSISDVVQQRVRWASKTANYTLNFGKLIGTIVLLGNGSIALLPILVFLKMIPLSTAFSYFLMKLLFDYLLIQKISLFYQQEMSFTNYLKSSIIYPYFSISIFIKSLFNSYQWKGRTFKK